VSQRATGLPWNSTFADAAEKVRDVASGQSQVAITGLVTLLGPAMMALSEGEQQGVIAGIAAGAAAVRTSVMLPSPLQRML